MGRSHSLPARASANCPRCGLANADAGEGLCAACGDRLGATTAPPGLPIGTTVGGHPITGARGEELLARAPSGEDVVLVLGSEALLALEAEVLGRLAGDTRVPRVATRGVDPEYGPFLALSVFDVSVRPLAEVARSLRMEGVLSLARAIVDLVERLAREGLSWTPLAHDFHLAPGGKLALSRVRCVGERPSTAPRRTDLRGVLEVVGGVLMPLPGALGPTRLVHLLAARRAARSIAPTTAPAVREELLQIEAEIAAPPTEMVRGVSALSDRGLRQLHNEDAIAVASGEIAGGPQTKPKPWSVLVVCDGVSSSTHAAEAAAIAATTARDALSLFARSERSRIEERARGDGDRDPRRPRGGLRDPAPDRRSRHRRTAGNHPRRRADPRANAHGRLGRRQSRVLGPRRARPSSSRAITPGPRRRLGAGTSPRRRR